MNAAAIVNNERFLERRKLEPLAFGKFQKIWALVEAGSVSCRISLTLFCIPFGRWLGILPAGRPPGARERTRGAQAADHRRAACNAVSPRCVGMIYWGHLWEDCLVVAMERMGRGRIARSRGARPCCSAMLKKKALVFLVHTSNGTKYQRANAIHAHPRCSTAGGRQRHRHLCEDFVWMSVPSQNSPRGRSTSLCL